MTSPSKPLLTYYGDDLTGSTDAMEALTLKGLDVVLFVKRPSPEQLARFAASHVVGLAGTSRARSPQWMNQHLTEDFGWLRSLGAPLCHYKVCSTFDSSPTTGSIGRAIDIGHRLFEQKLTPLIVGTPQLKRYTIFGNHFATVGGETYRLDRHPVMSQHPVTPMHEADLRLHLAKQTEKRIGLVTIVDIMAPDAQARIDRAAAQCDILLFDIADEATQAVAGRALWRMQQDGGTFCAGSSGIEYALVQEWSRLGLLNEAPNFSAPGPVKALAAVSGSCSPVTANQIKHAAAHGFEIIQLDPRVLADRRTAEAERGKAVTSAIEKLGRSKSVILATALGPETVVSEAQGLTAAMRDDLGHELGLILGELIRRAKLKRAVIAGGDSSSHALSELNLYALTTRLPLPAMPGAPLCHAHASEGEFDGLEIALKGGQLGKESYFADMRDGTF